VSDFIMPILRSFGELLANVALVGKYLTSSARPSSRAGHDGPLKHGIERLLHSPGLDFAQSK